MAGVFSIDMNTVTPEKKEKAKKILAVVGFLVLIGLIAYGAIAIIRYAPKGFTSLASLAESLHQYGDKVVEEANASLTLTSTATSTEAGEPVKITWQRPTDSGTYSFTYTCTDGVAVDLVDSEGLRSISCDTNYDLGDTDAVTIIIDSEKEKEATVDYTIAYTKHGEEESSQSDDDTLTVNNDKLAANDTTNVPEETPSPSPQSGGTKPAPTVIPVTKSYVDLATAFVDTGEIDGNTFEAGSLHKNSDGAVQFTVTNIGTRASGFWNYSATLPDGTLYTSPLQAPLASRERATISLGFPVDENSSHTFIIVAGDTNDIYLGNNSVRENVTIE